MRQTTLMRLMKPEDLFWSFDPALGQEINLRKADSEACFYETEEAYLTSVDVPGVNAGDISIEFEDGKLQITAERKFGFGKNQQTKKYFFEFLLPKNADKDKIEAHYENGVLSLAVRKLASDKKKITVTSGAKPAGWNFLGFGKKTNEDVQVVN